MVYYILLENEPLDALMYDSAILGETTDFGFIFYANRGLSKLMKLSSTYPEMLEKIRIFDDKNKQYNVEEFLHAIHKYKIITQ